MLNIAVLKAHAGNSVMHNVMLVMLVQHYERSHQQFVKT